MYIFLAEIDSSPLELASAPVSPQVAELSQDLSKTPSATARQRNTGSVKRISAYFESLDKQHPGAEGR